MANRRGRGHPKLKKKFLHSKPLYRPIRAGGLGGIACHPSGHEAHHLRP